MEPMFADAPAWFADLDRFGPEPFMADGRRQPPAGDAAPERMLRAWRLALARQGGLPPYMILHDTMLLAIVAARPRTLGELLNVPGIGPVKAEQYGRAILVLITGGRWTPPPGGGRRASGQARWLPLLQILRSAGAYRHDDCVPVRRMTHLARTPSRSRWVRCLRLRNQNPERFTVETAASRIQPSLPLPAVTRGRLRLRL